MDSSASNKLLLMGLIGFTAGILLAPDKGSVTRDKLKHKADKFADEASKKTEEAKRKLSDFRHRKDKVGDAIDAAETELTA